MALKAFRPLVVLPLARAQAIRRLVDRIDLYMRVNRVPQLLPLVDHVRKHFVDVYGPEGLSVHGAPHRTNNAVENGHHQLAKKMSGHRPSFDRFLGK